MKGLPATFERLTTRAGTVIDVVGEVDYSNTAAFEAAILDAATSGTVTVDLTRTAYLDSSGVRSLFWVANHGVRLVVVAPPSSLVHRTLQMAGLDLVTALVDERPSDVGDGDETSDGVSQPRHRVGP